MVENKERQENSPGAFVTIRFCIAGVKRGSKKSGFALDFDDGLAFIGSTVWADVMRLVIFAAAFAPDEVLEMQRIMGATPPDTAVRMFTLW
jgi:hypothetical protein